MTLRLKELFKKLKIENKPAFVSYITGGDPDYDKSLKIVDTLVNAGIDILELGIPFSDPLADGETNQLSVQRALNAGISPVKILEMTAEIRKKYPKLPIVLYSYLNPVAFAFNFKEFCKKAAAAGVDSLLLLDLTPEEGQNYYRKVIDEAGLSLVALVTPNTPHERLSLISKFATAFIYYVTREGVTGTRADFAGNVKEKIKEIRKYTELPVVMGFGISTAEQVKMAADTGTDGIVVGSAIVKEIEQYANGKKTLENLETFVRRQTSACLRIMVNS